MVTEDHPFVGGNKIASIVQPLGGRGTLGIQDQHLGGDEATVEAVAQGITAQGRDHQPHCIDLLAAVQGDGRECEGAQ